MSDWITPRAPILGRQWQRCTRALAGCALAWFFAAPLPGSEVDWVWQKLAPLPDPAGLAGCYAGISNGALVAGGGANFPERPPWEGGAKVWHEKVFVLEDPDGSWKQGFKLPLACAYGVAVTTPKGILCIGGSTADRHLTNTFYLQWTGQTVIAQPAPALPLPLAHACGVAIGESVYVAGGLERPDATRASDVFLRLDLGCETNGWQRLPPWPGRPRMLAAGASVNDTFYIVGGVELHPDADGTPARYYLRDGFAFTTEKGWRRIADMLKPVAGAPSPAPVLEPAGFLIIGGDDGSLLNFEPKAMHPGFPGQVLRYDAARDRWTERHATPAPRATLPSVQWRSLQVLISGEVKPGIRSPEVWTLRLE